MAFSLYNLLFACPSCNRSSKNDRFPLDVGGITITAEHSPPAGERPLLIDPAGSVNPVEHIKFIPIPLVFCTNDDVFSDSDIASQRWLAIPRNGSKHGSTTIEVADLNRMELVELRSDYVFQTVWPLAAELSEALTDGKRGNVIDRMSRAEKLIRRNLPFTALAYDALAFLIPAPRLAPFGLSWPDKGIVGTH
ncbi:MAG: hypothetical protein V4844_23245 [Pseudomonadota bacterium]